MRITLDQQLAQTTLCSVCADKLHNPYKIQQTSSCNAKFLNSWELNKEPHSVIEQGHKVWAQQKQREGDNKSPREEPKGEVQQGGCQVPKQNPTRAQAQRMDPTRP